VAIIPDLPVYSGIGPAKELEALGIPLKVDLPGVGKGLMDHACLGINVKADETKIATWDHLFQGDQAALMAAAEQYQKDRKVGRL
jgi:choline dehydrogenase-like flavoprotein